ncbi:unnamed protein product [Kuraishia capsulata CBS 1993]|uniref:Altered inheritance of mitochondria protein 18, mitochondrial n=1 Tax=Kuraishia capsulata CBS 1993 TaxID=1382522 RepID=W6MVQ3_9ASCO|nr:uncharacterized protein KUCA_T00006057001 [Kuraishia capsulata CBS 1993]CDK30062.1 unnamed protein product [Kuraishia capsulata CBS 1993]
MVSGLICVHRPMADLRAHILSADTYGEGASHTVGDSNDQHASHMFARRFVIPRFSPVRGWWVKPLVLSAAIPLYFSTTYAADSSIFQESSITVDSSVPPFPTSLDLASKYELLGYGSRSVTFLKFKVYALGIYINQQDISKIKQIWTPAYLKSVNSPNLEESLKNPNLSTILIDKLLTSGVRFTAKITPVRNTDFNHLRDGLVKSAMAHPMAKEASNANAVAEGLDQLRAIFNSKKGSAPKGTNLFLETLADGKLRISYQDKQMGIVEEPLVSRLLFLQYLSGKSPLSEQTRESSISGLLKV